MRPLADFSCLSNSQQIRDVCLKSPRLHQSKNLFHNPLQKSNVILYFVPQVWRALHRMQIFNLYETFTGFLKPEATKRVMQVKLLLIVLLFFFFFYLKQ